MIFWILVNQNKRIKEIFKNKKIKKISIKEKIKRIEVLSMNMKMMKKSKMELKIILKIR